MWVIVDLNQGASRIGGPAVSVATIVSVSCLCFAALLLSMLLGLPLSLPLALPLSLPLALPAPTDTQHLEQHAQCFRNVVPISGPKNSPTIVDRAIPTSNHIWITQCP
jgi:hypothetical protein